MTIKRVKRLSIWGLFLVKICPGMNMLNIYQKRSVVNIGIIEHIRSILPHESLTISYMTLVEPHFRYCDIVWGQCNETVQSRTARSGVICSRRFEDVDDHQELLNQLGWFNVRQLFSLDLGVLVFKAINDLIPDQFNEISSKSNSIHSHGTRAATTYCLFIEKTNLTARQKSISVSGSKLWNEIPYHILFENSQSFNVFRKK